MTATIELDLDRDVFAAEFDALLDTIEVVRIPAAVLPEQDFNTFTI